MFLTNNAEARQILAETVYKATCDASNKSCNDVLGSSEFDDNLSVFCCLHGDAEDDLLNNLSLSLSFNGIIPRTVAEAILHSYTSCIDVLINEWNVNNGLEDKLHDTEIEKEPIGGAIPVDPDWDLAKLPKLLQDPFWNCVEENPDNVAVFDTGITQDSEQAFRLSYREAGFAVNLVARRILECIEDKSGNNLIVAIIMHKGWEQVVSALAVLSCHATYIPIDAKWPAKRATQILEAAGAAAVLTTQALVEGMDNELSRAVPDGIPVVLFEAAVASMGEAAKEGVNPFTEDFCG